MMVWPLIVPGGAAAGARTNALPTKTVAHHDDSADFESPTLMGYSAPSEYGDAGQLQPPSPTSSAMSSWLSSSTPSWNHGSPQQSVANTHAQATTRPRHESVVMRSTQMPWRHRADWKGIPLNLQ
jgi:hypothetical protein